MKPAADVEVNDKMSIWTGCCIVSMVIALFDDLRERKIRVFPVVFCLGIGMTAKVFLGLFEWKEALIGVMPGVLSCLISKLCQNCIGAGDSLLILNIGLLHGCVFCIMTILLACIGIFVYSILMLFLKRIHRYSQVACVPFLFLGYIGAWLL